MKPKHPPSRHVWDHFTHRLNLAGPLGTWFQLCVDTLYQILDFCNDVCSKTHPPPQKKKNRKNKKSADSTRWDTLGGWNSVYNLCYLTPNGATSGHLQSVYPRYPHPAMTSFPIRWALPASSTPFPALCFAVFLNNLPRPSRELFNHPHPATPPHPTGCLKQRWRKPVHLPRSISSRVNHRWLTHWLCPLPTGAATKKQRRSDSSPCAVFSVRMKDLTPRDSVSVS